MVFAVRVFFNLFIYLLIFFIFIFFPFVVVKMVHMLFKCSAQLVRPSCFGCFSFLNCCVRCFSPISLYRKKKKKKKNQRLDGCPVLSVDV